MINVWCFTTEVPELIKRYKELNPELNFDIKATVISATDGNYQSALDQALAKGGTDAPDIYCVESGFSQKYTQGPEYYYAAPYKDLGIDVDELIEEAGTAQYIVDIGTNPEGDIIGLGYQCTGGVYIYRRSIAKEVWGTDDPEIIKNKIGPGIDKFTEAAATVKKKGYGMISSYDDLWHIAEAASEKGWVVDGRLYIDPQRESFLDIAKQYREKGYHNNISAWQNAWFDDMRGVGNQQVLGFFGPAWLINYIMEPNCGETYGDWAICKPPIGFYWGGTWILANRDTKSPSVVGDIIEWLTLDCSEDGLQYKWANGWIAGTGGVNDTVISSTVMKDIYAPNPFLGGQDMFEVLAGAGRYVSGKNITQYDAVINAYWLEQVYAYANGFKTRAQAIADFKELVAQYFDIEVN